MPSPSAGSTASSSTWRASPTCRRTTSTSTRHGGLLRRQGAVVHAGLRRGAASSASTTSVAGGWPSEREVPVTDAHIRGPTSRPTGACTTAVDRAWQHVHESRSARDGATVPCECAGRRVQRRQRRADHPHAGAGRPRRELAAAGLAMRADRRPDGAVRSTRLTRHSRSSTTRTRPTRSHGAGGAARPTRRPAHRRPRRRRRPGPRQASADGRRGARPPTSSSSPMTTRAPRRRRDPGRGAAGARGVADDAVPSFEVGDRREAIRAASAARPGDTVARRRQGPRAGQEIAGVVHPFDDRRAERRHRR